MKSEELINWGAWSRLLAGSRQTVRKNSIPKKHIPITKELIETIQSVIDKVQPKGDAVSVNER
jgi:hypothetical protein